MIACSGDSILSIRRLAQVRADVEVVDEEHLDLGDVALEQLVDLVLGDLFVALEHHFAGALVDHVVGADLGVELVGVDRQPGHLRVGQLLHVRAGELAVLLDDHLARLRLDVAGGALVEQQVGVDRLLELAAREQVDGLGGVEVVEDLFGRALELDRVLLRGVADRAQGANQHRRRQLAAAIDANVEQVFVVELEVDPRAAVGNDAGVVEQLARRVALALVVVEEGARRAVQLADDDGSVPLMMKVPHWVIRGISPK